MHQYNGSEIGWSFLNMTFCRLLIIVPLKMYSNLREQTGILFIQMLQLVRKLSKVEFILALCSIAKLNPYNTNSVPCLYKTKLVQNRSQPSRIYQQNMSLLTTPANHQNFQALEFMYIRQYEIAKYFIQAVG